MTTTATIKPVAGPLFRRAAKLPVDGAKRRKLLCLLAAYADAGERSPTVKELARRLEFRSPAMIDSLLDTLVADGWLEVEWAANGKPGHRAQPGKRNRYTLRLDGREGVNT